MPSTYRKLIRIYFYEGEEELYDWIQKMASSSPQNISFIKTNLEKIKKGELKEPDDIDLQEKKLLADIRIKEATATIKEHEAKYWTTFQSPPSWKAKGAIKQGALIPDTLIDKNNSVFKCPSCDVVFRWKFARDLSEKIQFFVDHWYKTHHGDPPQEFQHQLGQLSESLRS